jgi:uncharacterized circularly permuted ATP-grasp superfamily protein/uncharacterized alpha-E superfamily protein
MTPPYQPLDQVPDEMVGPEGLRALWAGFAKGFAALTPEEVERRRMRAELYLRDSGVFYRKYGEGQSVERPWPLSPIPVLIAEEEWNGLLPGLIQRAELLEALMADLYGPGRLVSEGHLPPKLVAGNPEWLRPMVGVRPASGHFLHFLAFEIGRGPDGGWWVLADRTQAPSGAGFALENRVATRRAFAELFAASHVHRLAGFFRDFRNAMAAPSRAAILTPGPLNETYWEHAYIARYLGLTLVQGEDLVVENGALLLRTVQGLVPVDVLWRRLDGIWADPIELDPASRIGTPGLVSALRAGKVTMVNALGSGLLETRAFMAFLPQIAQHLLGEPLLLPNIATWWCGDAKVRHEVLQTPAKLLLSDALATGLPYDRQEPITAAASLFPEALAALLARDGGRLVAQEAVRLSTTPALVEGALAPRPLSLRVFLARTAEGWQVMPGGFARVGATPEPTAVAMQRGGTAADVWIVSDREVEPVTNLDPTEAQSLPGALPARAADNLFWLGRYVERTEVLVRLLRAAHIRRAEMGDMAEPLLQAMAPLMTRRGVEAEPALPQALLDCLGAAIGSAGQVRDRFSPDAWAALKDIEKTARRMAPQVTPGDDAARALSALLRKLAGITGLVHENMYRFTGWRFLTLGRLLERAMAMAEILAVLTEARTPGALDLAIEIGDSVMTHRRRFAVAAGRGTVLQLLALDPMNPRALRHLVEAMAEQIATLPGAEDHGHLSPLAKAILRLRTDLAVAEPATLSHAMLWDLHARLGALSTLLTEAHLR